MSTRHAAVLAASLATVVLLLGGNAVAIAKTEPIQQQIDAHLAAYPGGKQTSPTEITYEDGKFVITFAEPGYTAHGADCPAEKFCFYDAVGYGFPRGRLADCGWQDLAAWGWQNRTDSVYYNLSTGSVTFIFHGGRADHGYDYGLFAVGTGLRGLPDVAPYRNQADHVLRYC